jgi:hypothetical protein
VHEGFYFRVHLGAAFLNMSTNDKLGNDLTISGGGGALNLAAGFAVRPNLILYGELLGDIAFGPTFELNGQTGTADNNVTAGVGGMGVGAAYYLMPANIYFSGTLSMAQLTVEAPGLEAVESDSGPGVTLVAGKEWLVSPKWGVGIAAQAFFGLIPEKNTDATWKTTALALLFSATYN